MSTTRGTEEVNKEGAIETKMEIVDTVDYRSPPGQEQTEPNKEDVQVVHLTRTGPDSGGRGRGGGGVFSGGAAAVANAVQSAKDAISGSGKDKTTK